MYRSDSAHDPVDRDSRMDQRRRPEDERVVDRTAISADGPREMDPDLLARPDRRRTERRRIERMGTDI